MSVLHPACVQVENTFENVIHSFGVTLIPSGTYCVILM